MIIILTVEFYSQLTLESLQSIQHDQLLIPDFFPMNQNSSAYTAI